MKFHAFNLGNWILKTLEAPWGVSKPWATKTEPTPVGRVLKIRQITLRQEVFEPDQEKFEEILAYFRGLNLKEFFSAFGQKPKAIAIGNFNTGPGSILPDYTYHIDLTKGVSELEKFYKTPNASSEKQK